MSFRCSRANLKPSSHWPKTGLSHASAAFGDCAGSVVVNARTSRCEPFNETRGPEKKEW